MKYPSITNNRNISYAIVISLFGLWVVMFTLFLSSQETSLTTIEQRHEITNNYDFPLRLNKSETFTQTIRPKHDQLGQIAVRFQTHRRINQDTLIFRIKQANSSDWDYTAIHKTDQFQPDQFFPFGFPVYPDSKGKEYIWEIESVTGQLLDSVSVSDSRPIYVSRYQFDKSKMATDQGLLSGFLFNKALNIVQNPDSLVKLILWGAPLFIYLLAAGSIETRKNFFRVAAVPLVILIIDNLFVVTQYDTTTFLLFILWLSIVLSYQPPKFYIISFALFNLFLSLTLNLLGKPQQADKPFTWFFLFLMIFIISDIYNRTKRPKPKKPSQKLKS